MSLITGFHGGIHPPEAKITSSAQIEVMPPPQKVIIPLSQHTGSPAKAVVKAGDRVTTGQLIAEATGFISANIHSSISGTVSAIELCSHPSGTMVESIVIESDEKDEKAEFKPLKEDEETPERIIEAVKNAGIVGLGGAAFPTHVKLSPPKNAKIDTAILNGCECEPYLTCDHRVMLEETEKIIEGFRLIMKALGVKKGIIAVEDNKKDAIAKITSAVGSASGISIVKLKTKYPQGAEKQLIKSLLGREVPSGKLPLDVGCVVQNVQTSIAIFESVKTGKPLYERVITVTGRVKNPKNLKVRIGTTLNKIIEYCGGMDGEIKKVIAGGPMMGPSITDLEIPLIKGISGILLLGPKEAKIFEPSSCIKCATCIKSCPMGLSPCIILRLVEKGRSQELRKYNVLDCIECGTCSYGCPAKAYLVQNMKLAKELVRQLDRKEKK